MDLLMDFMRGAYFAPTFEPFLGIDVGKMQSDAKKTTDVKHFMHQVRSRTLSTRKSPHALGFALALQHL
jgi:hypothetical protein